MGFSPNGKLLALSNVVPPHLKGYSELRLIDLERGQEKLTFQRADDLYFLNSSFAFSPDGRFLAAAGDGNTARLWNADTGELVRDLKGHKGKVTSLAFSSDGKKLLTGSLDQTVRVWNYTIDPESLVLSMDPYSQLDPKFWPIPIRIASFCVSFSPDCKFLAAGHGFPPNTSAFGASGIDVWDIFSGKYIHGFSGKSDYATQNTYFAPDGRRVFGSSKNMLIVADLASGREVRSFLVSDHKKSVPDIHSLDVNGMACSSDGKYLATASSDKMVKLWDPDTGKVIKTLEGHSSGVLCVAYSPDGKRLASGSEKGEIIFWDVNTGKRHHTLEAPKRSVTAICFGPDGTKLASVTGENLGFLGGNREIKVWSARTGKELFSIQGQTSSVTSVAFSPDGKRLASGSSDRTVKIWDTATGRDLLTLQGHTGAVLGVAFSNDGRKLASAGDDNTVRVWDGTPLD